MNDQTKLGPEQRQEIATIARDITYPAFLGVLIHQDDTLTTRGSARSYKIYDDIERDCRAYGDLQKRKLAVVARPWQVDPASEDALDVKAADLVREQLTNIGVPEQDGEQIAVPTNFDMVCVNLLDALLKGFAIGEVMWVRDGSEVVATEIRPRDQRRFLFDTEYKLRMKTFEDLLHGVPVPQRKFVVHTFGAKDGSPYGMGLGSKLFWPALFKRQGITFWATFLDKFGSPTAIGKYPSGTQSSEKDKLLDALAAIAQDAGVAIPEGMIIELLEAARSGSVSYEDFCRYMDEQMSYAVLGEAAGGQNSGGALASAAILRNEVRLELVQADCDLLSSTLNSTLVPWITQFNVPGARPPKVWRQVKAAEDLKVRSARDKNLYAIGFRPTLAHVKETYGGEWELVKNTAATPPAAEPAAEFAEGGAAPVQDALSDRLAEESAPGWNALLTRVRGIVDKAESLESLRDDLIAAFADLPSDELARVMTAGFAVAELAGMADVDAGH